MQKVLDLAVLSGFEYICLLNLTSGEYLIHGSEENTHGIPERGSFNKSVEIVRDGIVVPEERESYYEKMKLETVASRMQENGTYSCKYNTTLGIRRVSFQWFEPTQTQVLMTVQRSI